MKLRKIIAIAFASSALLASAQTITLNLPNTGADGSVIGSADPNWSVFRFSSLSGNDVVTGATGLSSYLDYVNTGTPSVHLAAVDATPYSGWITPGAGATWLAVEANSSSHRATHDSTNGGGYAFVFNLGAVLDSRGASFSDPLSFSFNLNGDNGFSAHLIDLDLPNHYSGTANLLGTTTQNYGAATGTAVSFSGNTASTTQLTNTTRLVVLLSNDFQTTGNPGGILVQNFTATYSPIPEPSTYAAVFGAGTLLVAILRRRKRA